jgi:hypothetical protein
VHYPAPVGAVDPDLAQRCADLPADRRPRAAALKEARPTTTRPPARADPGGIGTIMRELSVASLTERSILRA